MAIKKSVPGVKLYVFALCWVPLVRLYLYKDAIGREKINVA